jgi:hypothetical protein
MFAVYYRPVQQIIPNAVHLGETVPISLEKTLQAARKSVMLELDRIIPTEFALEDVTKAKRWVETRKDSDFVWAYVDLPSDKPMFRFYIQRIDANI